MAKMTQCKVCGAQIAKGAKVCPNCGKRRRGAGKIIGTIFLVLLIVIIIGAVLNSNGDGPRKVGDAASEGGAAPSATELTVFCVGDKVELNDVIVTLVNVSESAGGGFMTPEDGKVYLLCEFEIENDSSSEIAVSSMLSFSAYVDGYATNLDLGAIASSDRSQLDGSVAPGKKMNGIIGYSVDQQWTEFEIRFTPDFWSGREIVFSHRK